ncbi:helix-turn-helix transcriptional regulator [Haloimpatiens massiliensis]|uniref:helix-turn-helix transcriptional regulator n=1 Tax=Haloimpatiens massiliensis TaxID=1658110 RepID=UPI000C82A45F|nr:helix-turn-helix transcriptional regulator [Haloimpatiens massiliensis]
MKGTVKIFNKEFEYDFLSAWIKYNRLQNQYTQEALAHGVCSTSHLSYFESGKKLLRGEIIEALLKKMNIHEIKEIYDMGAIRQKFYNMMFEIENLNYDNARAIYQEISSMEYLIILSPYNIEYTIYKFIYNFLLDKKSYTDLKQDVLTLDKIYSSLSEELKYLYMFMSGKLIFKYKDHDEGIQRLLAANKIKDTPWINYHLGFSYCFDDKPLKGVYYLEKSLESYERNGRYLNALWCHNYLGICYNFLNIHDESEKHFKAALTGGEYFNIDDILWHVYTNLSDLYLHLKKYNESVLWSKKALHTPHDPLLPASNYVEACIKLNKLEECKKIFSTYLVEEHKNSKYYYWLYFLNLSIFHIEEELFYEEVTQKILPYYQGINYIEFWKSIKIKLIEYLEKRRKYKEANKIYKELLT